jgi:hypothetical protein
VIVFVDGSTLPSNHTGKALKGEERRLLRVHLCLTERTLEGAVGSLLMRGACFTRPSSTTDPVETRCEACQLVQLTLLAAACARPGETSEPGPYTVVAAVAVPGV